MSQVERRTSRTDWWRPRRVGDGRSLELQLGPLTLAVGRSAGAWLVAVSREEARDTASRACCRVRRRLPEQFEARYVQAQSAEWLRFEPLLADRPVVVRPYRPVFLLSHEEVTLYLSTPVFIRVAAGDPPTVLREIPSQPMSDTWFGPNTRSGELCFAGRTQARHRLEELPVRAHRAITPLRIRNATEAALELEKFSLPVPVLTLFGAGNGSLWTQQVTLVREEVGDLARVAIEGQPPDIGQALERLAGPRQDPERGNLVMRTFSALFGAGGH